MGVSGNSSNELLGRFENEITARNKYGEIAIVISIGLNDSRAKGDTNFSDTTKYLENLHDLLKQSRTYSQKILFVGLTACVNERSNPVAWGNTGYTNGRIQEFNDVLCNFCKQNNVPL